MRVITGLLQGLVVIAVALGVFLLVADPRLRDLAWEDLSALVPGGAQASSESKATTTASNPGGATKNSPKSESSPTVTDTGYTIASSCALWPVEGLNLYYSPADPTSICVQPPGSPTPAGDPPAPGTAQIPPNCATAPDGTNYCLAGGELTADTLEAFYERGELQSPREPGGGGG